MPGCQRISACRNEWTTRDGDDGCVGSQQVPPHTSDADGPRPFSLNWRVSAGPSVPKPHPMPSNVAIFRMPCWRVARAFPDGLFRLRQGGVEMENAIAFGRQFGSKWHSALSPERRIELRAERTIETGTCMKIRSRASNQSKFLAALVRTAYLPVEIPPAITTRYLALFCEAEYSYLKTQKHSLIRLSTKYDTFTAPRPVSGRRNLAVVHMFQESVNILSRSSSAPRKAKRISARARAPRMRRACAP